MAHAEICPICLGEGKIRPEGIWSEDCKITCHGCGGKGWVEVGNSDSIWTQNDLHTDYLPIPTAEEIING